MRQFVFCLKNKRSIFQIYVEIDNNFINYDEIVDSIKNNYYLWNLNDGYDFLFNSKLIIYIDDGRGRYIEKS